VLLNESSINPLPRNAHDMNKYVIVGFGVDHHHHHHVQKGGLGVLPVP